MEDNQEKWKNPLVIAYEDGFTAYDAGHKHDTNPHPYHSNAWNSWHRGWNTANHFAVMTNAHNPNTL